MGELRDDQEKRKRKIAGVPYDNSPQQYAFRNDFATYAASTTLMAPPSSSGLPRDEYSPDMVDGHDNKKFKIVPKLSVSATTPSPTLNFFKEKDSFSSVSAPSSPEIGPQDVSGSPAFSTPPSMGGKCYNSCPSSISPFSALSSQNSMNSTASRPSVSLPSSANHEENFFSHGDHLDLVMAQRLFERPTTKDVFNNLKADLQPILVKRLKELSQLEPTVEVGLEMTDSAYLLKLLSSSNPKLENVGKKAGRGAMLLQEGMRLTAEGRELLRSAILELSSLE